MENKKEVTAQEMELIVAELKKIKCSYLISITEGDGTYSQTYDTFPNSASFFHASAVQFSNAIRMEFKKHDKSSIATACLLALITEVVSDMHDTIEKAIDESLK